MSKAGAPAAYRGYRLQALYTIKRILTQGSDDLIFHPEGKEDLDVLDANGNLLQAIQVKSYHNLSLSDLEPAKKDSFFRRVIDLLKNSASPAIKLVNFGAIGPEMRQAWSNKTPKDKAKRTSISKKLKGKGFKPSQISKIFAHVELVELFEKPEEADVYQLLRDMLTGIDPENAFDLLNHWIYRASEAQRQITKGEIIEKIHQVGRFLAECRTHHAEWFTSIRPIATRLVPDEQHITLRKEFYEGVSARYEHILADLDFRRDAKLAEIRQSFERSHVVIIHAASGQGKTTLAYRYLHDTYPEKWRFSIELIENRQHALSIATALSGHANAIQAPMAVYIDVRPSDTAWPELVRQLARHPYLNVLVTVREEDFRRANLPRTEFDFEEIDLGFNEDEAQLIFARAIESQRLAKYLDFEAAWHDFGGDGPLMEFVYLLTQATTLHQRLKEQVQRLRHETRERKLSSDELDLLRLVAVATAYEARLHTRPLVKRLRLPEPSLTFELFEKEYLIRLSDDKQSIEALHPIRSRILVDLLTDQDFNPWLDIATDVLPLLLEEDLEYFILHAFVDRPEAEYKPFFTVVNNLEPTTWTGLAGVLRSLLWAGVRDYLEANREPIEEASQEMPQGWWLVFDFDLTNLLQDSQALDSLLWKLVTPERKDKIIKLRQRQTPKSEIFKPVSDWLSSLPRNPPSPLSEADWTNMAEVLYWSGYLCTAPDLETWLTDNELAFVTSKPLAIVADLSVSLYMCNQKRHERWMQANRPSLEARLAHEYHILGLEKKENSLKIHFRPLPIEIDSEPKLGTQIRRPKPSNAVHAATMERIELIRRLFPMYDRYGAQGYGHRLGTLSPSFDDTTKNIQVKSLPLSSLVRINAIVIELGNKKHRPEDWPEYVKQLLQIRQLVVSCLEELQPALSTFIESKKAINLFKKGIDSKKWDQTRETLLKSLPDFPKCAIDPWGFVSESTSDPSKTNSTQPKHLSTALALRKYKPYVTVQRDYLGSIKNFLDQATHVISTNFVIGKRDPSDPQRADLIAQLQKKGIKTDWGHLSTRNFWKAVRSLPTYQEEFRKLFGHLVDSDLLTNLEQRERKVVPKTWQLWYFFSYYPHERVPKAHKAIRRKVTKAKRELDKKIKKALSKVRSKGAKVTILNPDMSWNDSPTLWLRLDLNDPTRLYEVFEELIGSLKAKLGPRDVKSLTDYLIEEHYEYTVIVPVIRGRMLNEFVWPLLTAITLLSTESIEQKILSYIPQPFPSEMRKALGLELWDFEDITLANTLSTAVSSLMILAAQLGEFRSLPEANITEQGFVVLKTHVAEQSQNLTKWLQDYLDAVVILCERFNTLPKREQERREKLLQAATILTQIHNDVLPVITILSKIHDEILLSESNGLYTVSLGKMAEYAQRIENTMSFIETIRLFWIADVLEQHLMT